jgi:aryl-alcohol dehydrogenase-like predicted oxidoreductase
MTVGPSAFSAMVNSWASFSVLSTSTARHPKPAAMEAISSPGNRGRRPPRRAPAQVALAWLLGIAPNVLLIAGTTSRGHLAENLAAADLALSDDEIASLTNAFS